MEIHIRMRQVLMKCKRPILCKVRLHPSQHNKKDCVTVDSYNLLLCHSQYITGYYVLGTTCFDLYLVVAGGPYFTTCEHKTVKLNCLQLLLLLLLLSSSSSPPSALQPWPPLAIIIVY
jgi:hypothetical protein